MFIENKYLKIYYQICDRGKLCRKLEYSEKHHIIPRSFGGNNKAENITVLTAREHYIAHLCLFRCTIGEYKKKMGFALFVFKRQNTIQKEQNVKFNSKIYSSLKQYMIENKTNSRKWTDDEKKKMSIAKTGITWGKHSKESKQKMSEGAKARGQKPPGGAIYKGYKFSKKRKTHSPTIEHRKKLQEANKKYYTLNPLIILVCPFCNTIGKGNSMYRHHFKNCTKQTTIKKRNRSIKIDEIFYKTAKEASIKTGINRILLLNIINNSNEIPEISGKLIINDIVYNNILVAHTTTLISKNKLGKIWKKQNNIKKL